jgi:hypothetical protein
MELDAVVQRRPRCVDGSVRGMTQLRGPLLERDAVLLGEGAVRGEVAQWPAFAPFVRLERRRSLG